MYQKDKRAISGKFEVRKFLGYSHDMKVKVS